MKVCGYVPRPRTWSILPLMPFGYANGSGYTKMERESGLSKADSVLVASWMLKARTWPPELQQRLDYLRDCLSLYQYVLASTWRPGMLLVRSSKAFPSVLLNITCGRKAIPHHADKSAFVLLRMSGVISGKSHRARSRYKIENFIFININFSGLWNIYIIFFYLTLWMAFNIFRGFYYFCFGVIFI